MTPETLKDGNPLYEWMLEYDQGWDSHEMAFKKLMAIVNSRESALAEEVERLKKAVETARQYAFEEVKKKLLTMHDEATRSTFNSEGRIPVDGMRAIERCMNAVSKMKTEVKP